MTVILGTFQFLKCKLSLSCSYRFASTCAAPADVLRLSNREFSDRNHRILQNIGQVCHIVLLLLKYTRRSLLMHSRVSLISRSPSTPPISLLVLLYIYSFSSFSSSCPSITNKSQLPSHFWNLRVETKWFRSGLPANNFETKFRKRESQ